jgi:O-Antigen ligase
MRVNRGKFQPESLQRRMSVSSVVSRRRSATSKFNNASLAALLVAASLPFMQMLTINAGFPLKIYEIVLVLSTMVSAITVHLTIFNKRVFLWGLVFVAYSLAALSIKLMVLGEVGTFSSLARFGPFLDGAFKAAYIALGVLGFNLIASAAEQSPTRVVQAWLWGASLSAVIHLFFVTLSGAGQPVPHLPGMLPYPTGQQFMLVGGHSLFRAGTFLEGNYAGPFFVFSFLLAISYKRTVPAALCFAAIIASFSTTALIGLGAAFIYLAIRGGNSFFVLLAVLAIVVFASTPIFDEVVLNKLSDTDPNSSAADRLETFWQSWEMFLEHPLMGVGVSQYGLYIPGAEFWSPDNGNVAGGVSGKMMKAIPNNVYMELASEFGIVGIVIFAVFMISILSLVRRCPHPPLRAGAIALLVFWLASPTFTVMYYWAFLGIVCGLAKNTETAKPYLDSLVLLRGKMR